jgi:hypothetical protein
MANAKAEGETGDLALHGRDEVALLEGAADEGLRAFMRACDADPSKFARGHYVVIDPTTLDFVTAPTQAGAIERFVQTFPRARGSLHRVGEEFDVR